jgi:hypothetical protein
MHGFGRYEFQLMLLRRMQDFQPLLVQEALDSLDATKADLMAAHRRWSTLQWSRRFPHDVGQFSAALGPYDSERTLVYGEAQLVARRWALPRLWPDLAWEVLTDPAGTVLQQWLVRASGSPRSVRPVDTIAPWSCVVGDLMAAHEGARQVDLQVPSRWGVVVGDQLATFVWGLFQVAEPVSRNP